MNLISIYIGFLFGLLFVVLGGALLVLQGIPFDLGPIPQEAFGAFLMLYGGVRLFMTWKRYKWMQAAEAEGEEDGQNPVA